MRSWRSSRAASNEARAGEGPSPALRPGSDLGRLRRGRRGGVRLVTQVANQIFDVCELLLEIALIALQALEKLDAVRERAAEMEPSVSAVVVHCHLLSS